MNESGFSISGLLQGAAQTGLGYLDRRVDVDIQKRLTRATTPEIASDQRPIVNTVPNQTFGLAGGLLPLLIVGIAAFVLLRK